MNTLPPKLELRDLCRRVGGRFAIQDVCVAAGEGQCLALLGPSGSGKTTILRLIAGLDAPDQGEIRIDGRVVSRPGVLLPPGQRGVGLVFQGLALWPHMTVEQNLRFGINRKRLEGDPRAHVHQTLAQMKLQALADQYPSQLSGGEMQRVALGRALINRPAILLLDEPLGNLDWGLRQEFLDELGRLKREEHITLVFVSHDRDEIRAISDRAAVLLDGKVVETGSVGQLLTEAQTDVARRILGDRHAPGARS